MSSWVSVCIKKTYWKLHLIRSFPYQRIFEFCFLLLMQNSSVYYTVALIPASGCKKWPILENSKFRAARPPWIPTLSFYKKSEAEGVKKNLEHVLKLAPTPRKTLFFLLLSHAFSSLLHQLTGKNRKIKFSAHSAENESDGVCFVFLIEKRTFSNS